MILVHSFPTALAAVPLTINQDMKAVVPFRNDLARMLLIVTQGMASQVLKLVSRSTHGTCKLLTHDLFGLALPIPPLPEQTRIVARVDEVMALCDRLEAAQAERERRRDRLVAASTSRLNEPDSTSESREHVRFHLRHLPRLSTRREHIKQLRQTILNLAVRGRLVPQDPNDKPAQDLLHRIRDKKARLVSEGSLRKEKPLAAVNDVPFSTPSSWRWAQIGRCALFTDYGTSVKSDNIEGGVPVLKMRPPLTEQHRIVTAVDELMVVCDKLEAQLAVAETESSRLLESTLHEALAVA